MMRAAKSRAMRLDRSIKKDHTKQKLVFFLILTAALLLVTIFARQFSPFDPDQQNFDIALQPPDLAHPFGTDRYGRDMLSRVMAGARVSIFSSLIVVAIISVGGAAIGILCGYCGKAVDTVLMRISDVFLAFPGLVFALAIASVLNGGIESAVIALAAVSWPKYARLARSQTLVIKNRDFMQAARLAGNTPLKMVIRHVLPNIAGQLLVTAVMDIGTMIMEIAGLSFLGLGAQPPTAEWGSMMSDGRSMLQTCPWVVLSPGAGIFLSVLIFNLLGDTVRDYLDPRGRGRRRK